MKPEGMFVRKLERSASAGCCRTVDVITVHSLRTRAGTHERNRFYENTSTHSVADRRVDTHYGSVARGCLEWKAFPPLTLPRI